MQSREGTQASDFRLTDVSGAVHCLDDYHNNWLLLVFHRHLS
jgi:peroxiredoxin